MLEVDRLSFTHGSAALGPVSFTLPHPGCWWLTGASGAGKSLLLESLAGFHAETSGEIRIEDRQVSELAPERRSMALMPQRWRLFPHWTVAGNLRFAARLSAASSARVTKLVVDLAVDRLLSRPIMALSGGETQRVALIQTLLSPAKVLLLDEPLSAVGATLQSVILDLLEQECFRNQRICIIAAHRAVPGALLQGELIIQAGRLSGTGPLAPKPATLPPVRIRTE